jgi:UMF1 family MFS transporter
MLVRLTPPDQMGSVFGLAALTGSATNWLAPLLIGVFTATWGSQQAGFVPLLILLGLGLAGMLFVRGGDRFIDGKDE